MIIVDLECANAHRFEGWFKSAEDFAAQRTQRQVSCPVCGSHEIERRPSASHVARAAPAPAPSIDPAQLAARIVSALQQEASKAEDLGRAFADEARRIHHGEAEARSIRGEATLAEARELADEGISVLPLPGKPDSLH